jgi:phosphoribosylanthranilate isomerase
MGFICKIKLSEVNNLSDARFGAAAGFDYLGFCFNPLSPSFIPPVKAKEIIDWVTGPYMVGEFGEQTVDEINQIAELLQLDMIEVNNQLLPDELTKLCRPVIKCIHTALLNLEQLENEVQAYSNACAGFAFISSTNDRQKLSGIKVLLPEHIALFIGGIDNPDELYLTFESTRADGIWITGSLEEMVGLKDFDQLNILIEKFTIIEG